MDRPLLNNMERRIKSIEKSTEVMRRQYSITKDERNKKPEVKVDRSRMLSFKLTDSRKN